MAEIEPLTPNETRDLLAGIAETPVPEGMARRAVERWIEESRQARPRNRLAALLGLPGMRPAIALAAAAILVVIVRTRMGDEVAPAPPITTANRSFDAGPVLPEQTREQRADVTDRQRARAKEHKANASVRPPMAPRVAAAPAPHRSPTASPSVQTTADRSAKGETAPASRQKHTEAAAMRSALSAEMPSADLAYLNGLEPPETEGADDSRVEDARLTTRITLSEDEIAVSDLAGKLGAATGTAIALSDPVMRETLAVHCDDRPLREVMRQMARALDLRWERAHRDGIARYVGVPAPDQELKPSPGAMAGARAPAGMGGAMRADGIQARTPSAPQRAKSDLARNVIGSPERVRAMRQQGVVPPDAVQSEGWVIVR